MAVVSTRTRLAVGAAFLVPGLVLVAAPNAAAAPGALVSVDGTAPRWLATSTNQRQAASPASENKRLKIRVLLAPKGGQAALEAKVAALSDPSSPDYGHWLTPAQYRSAYAPTKASATAVTSYLKAQRVKVLAVEPNRRYVSAEGTVEQLNSAFHVTLRSYSHDGQRVTAPAGAAKLPSSVARSVLTVSGLDTTVTKKSPRKSKAVTPPDGFLNARPCAKAYGSIKAKYQADFKTKLPTFKGKTLSYAICGYTGPQLRSAYEEGSDLAGQGVTVAITDAYRWQLIKSDANRYAVENGDGAYASGQLTENVPTSYNSEEDCDPSGWSGEETLDVEAVHAMAPAANIRYYASASCNDGDFIDTLARVVDENKAQIVSNSWADVEENEGSDSVVAYHQILIQGAMQGISFMFSSGDNGDELQNTGLKQVDFPASSPYVTAVGGTATGIGRTGTKAFDAGWGTRKYVLSSSGKSWSGAGYLYGAGGGRSALFNQPSWQKGIASTAGARGVPDVALDADPTTGMLVGQTQTFPDGVRYGEYRIGGTSLASPLLAGMTALAVENNGGRGLGLLNPRLYQTPVLTDDVTKQPTRLGNVRVDYVNGVDDAEGLSYSVRSFGQDSSLPVTEGWDEVTGVGVPNTNFFNDAPGASPAAARR